MRFPTLFPRFAAPAALALAAACASDEVAPSGITNPQFTANTGVLTRYVALGNSITAGFQSSGINDSTQQRAYPVLFARAARIPFYYPSLAGIGCPPPFTINVTQARVGGGAATTCGLRSPNAFPYLSNLAVPGARMLDAANNFAPTSAANQLTQFILGGRTQLQALRAANPTLVSLWLGNNEILGSLTNVNTANPAASQPGDSTLVVPVATFQAQAKAVLDTIQILGAQAVIIGVGDISSLPYASTGTLYHCLRNGGCPGITPALPPALTVTNCLPPRADSVLVPWPIGIGLVNAAAGNIPVTLDCNNTAQVVTPAEFRFLRTTVAAYNAYLSSEATARAWPFMDPNPILQQGRTIAGAVLPFPALPSPQTGGNLLFGTWFSLDGVHPSSLAHRIFADSLISLVNRRYGRTIGFIGQTP
ncbi:MAG: SGNH/GDSL hydrolase family protein [Gemmatimonadales bacterium]|nr:SGNH/GDSL hydrolase family protein [Gemmatimonadales bacterium]